MKIKSVFVLVFTRVCPVFLQVVALVVLVTLPCVLSAPTNNGKCKRQTHTELHQKWLSAKSSRDAHESIYITPPFTSFIRDLRPTEGENVHFYGDNQECPTEPASDTSPVQDRSNCPWYNVLNKDETRYPDVVTEARCRCTGCIGVDGLSQCKPVYYNIHVLRQTGQCDEDGFHKWESGWVKISVGCTCARKPTV